MVSAQMRRMPRTSTRPEVALRKALHARGLRFRLHRRDLPGTPDVVFPATKIAVFVDGCFWHGCPEHGVLPKNNREWWQQKLQGNFERDRRKDDELQSIGWMPVHLWEHQAVTEMVETVITASAVRLGAGRNQRAAGTMLRTETGSRKRRDSA